MGAPAKRWALPRFSRDFWFINLVELFERGAFYSVAAVLAVALAATLSDATVGFILALLFYLLYFVPLLSAPFAEKYGYKVALVVSFALLVGGYAALLLGGTVPLVIAGVLLIGFGAGVFKPIAAAIVAQSTTEDQRNFAFIIYYAFINVGGFVFPLGVGLVGLLDPAFLNPVAFGFATALAALNLVLCLVFFKNLRAPQKDVKVFAALKSLVEVFREWRLLVLILVYAGFWVMYAMNQSFLPVYMVDFGRMPEWFNPALLSTINPLIIIVGAPFIGKLIEKKDSLAMILVGVLMYAVGFVMLGFSTSKFWFVTGVLVFSTGELVAHPAYLSYVTKIAPAGKESVYLGYGFIAIGLGYVLGTGVGGVVYGRTATDAGQPVMFWAIMASVGLVTAAFLLLYNRFLAPSKGRVVSEAKKGAFARMAGPAGAAVALLLIPGLVAAAAALEGGAPPPTLGGGALAVVALADQTGTTAEGDASEAAFTLPAGATGNATFTLAWVDEAGGTGTTNQPDTFKVEVEGPGGINVQSADTANPAGGEGEIVVKVPARPGTYTITVRLVQAGDEVVQVGPIPVAAGQQPDTGNAWTLAGAYEAPR